MTSACRCVCFKQVLFEAQGLNDAALEAYKDALRSKKRDADLLKEARYGRGRLYIAIGKKAQGRKELERLYAEDRSSVMLRNSLQTLS